MDAWCARLRRAEAADLAMSAELPKRRPGESYEQYQAVLDRWRADRAESPQQAFSRRYTLGGWSIKPGQPRSGGGSTLVATNTTCAVLLQALLVVAKQRSGGGRVRILDAPCGDFTWMPTCLRWVARKAPGLAMSYRGVDVVDSLVAQLNARGGEMLRVRGDDFALPRQVHLLPFLRADVSNATEMRRFRGHVDVILSKHMLIHLPNVYVSLALEAWNAIDASLLVKDNTLLANRRRNLDTNMVGGRDADVHAGPFYVAPPLCAENDRGLCAAEGKCNDRIEILDMPLRRGWGVNMTAAARRAHARTIPSCLSSEWRWTGGRGGGR